MRNKKIYAVLSASVLAVMAASLTSFAATGWTQENGTWRYYDSNGDYASDMWKKSGDHYFYLDSEGNMLKDQLVDHDGDYYGVDVNGAQIRNRWEKFQNDDGDYEWYYFTSTGKAKDNGWITVSGKKYHFTDSEMDSGWYEDDSNTYYLGEEDDGAAQTGWLDYDGMDDDENKEEGWYYFESSGKMVKNKEKKIGNYYYSFDSDGLMLDQWVTYSQATSSTVKATTTNKYYIESDGNRATGWRYLDDIDLEDSDVETEAGWYYFKSGKAYTANYKTTKISNDAGIAKINGKYYCFDENGKMLDGTVTASNGKVFYFGNEDDGSMKTGKVKVKNSDEYEDETMYFSKKGAVGEKGASVTGVEGGYLYDNGVLVDSDDKYEVVTVGGLDYLIRESGKVVTSGTVKDNDNGIKYTVKKNTATGGYDITTAAID